MALVSKSPAMTAKQAAEYLSMSAQTLAVDRMTSTQGGTPPLIPYVKIGPKMVRYLRDDLDIFLSKNRVGGAD